MNSIATKTVRELAVEIPGATRVFENLGIDYCCGGDRTLDDACDAAGVTVEYVTTSLEQVDGSHANFEEPNFLTATPNSPITSSKSIMSFTKTEMARLRALMDKVCSVHGKNHPELERLRSLFQTLSAELEPHMMKEERVLFPFIMGMEDAVHKSRPIQVPPFGTVANPVRMMMLEHDGAGENCSGRSARPARTTPFQPTPASVIGLCIRRSTHSRWIYTSTFIWRTTFCFHARSKWKRAFPLSERVLVVFIAWR